jgi:hypothetical protein
MSFLMRSKWSLDQGHLLASADALASCRMLFGSRFCPLLLRLSEMHLLGMVVEIP